MDPRALNPMIQEPYTIQRLKIQPLPQLLVKDVWSEEEQIIHVTSSTNLETTLRIIKENEITSVPVVEDGTQRCVGVLSIIDIASFIVGCYPSLDKINAENLQYLEYGGRRLAVEATVMNVLDTKRNRSPDANVVPAFTESTSLMQLMETFASGIHRAPVVNTVQNRITNFVSQSDVIRYAAENIHLLGSLAQRTLEELGVVSFTVHYARADAIVVAALARLTEVQVSALPIVDQYGRLVGNFSASDLKQLGPGDFPRLLMSLTEFLEMYNPKSLFPLTCTPNDTLEQAIFKLSATRVHRLWCMNPQTNTVIGVVSLTDLFKPLVGIKPMDLAAAVSPTVSHTRPTMLTPPIFGSR